MFDSDSPDAGSIPFVNDEISPPLPFLKQSHKAGSFDSSSFNLDDSDGSKSIALYRLFAFITNKETK